MTIGFGSIAVSAPGGSAQTGYNGISCSAIQWSSGPLAGMGGTISVGAGISTETIGGSNGPINVIYGGSGTCAVSVQ
jgi:hypothetical protein